MPVFSRQAEEKLLAHQWKGNVRELDNCMQRATILAGGNQIGESDIFFEDSLSGGMNADSSAVSMGVTDTKIQSGAMLDGDLKARERQIIVDALKAVDGCRKDAADRLGISPRTLRYKLARLKEQGVTIPAAS